MEVAIRNGTICCFSFCASGGMRRYTDSSGLIDCSVFLVWQWSARCCGGSIRGGRRLVSWNLQKKTRTRKYYREFLLYRAIFSTCCKRKKSIRVDQMQQ